MKLMFISDIHGVSKNLEYIKNKFENLECDKLVVLGDLVSGPINNEFYNTNYVINFLNSFRDNIICLKGNCDLVSDYKNYDFFVHDDLFKLEVDGLIFYLNHGNIYNYENPKEIKNGILIYGHEHIPYIRKKQNLLCINPGSISLPRGYFKESYLIYDNGKFMVYDIDDKLIDEYILKV